MSGSHHAPEPGRDGRYSLEDTIYDLPGPDALRPLSDLRQAALRMDNLEEALAYLAKRMDELTGAAMSDLGRTSHETERLRSELDGVNRVAVTAQTQGAAHERRLAALERTVAYQADALQVLVSRLEDGK